MPYRSVGLIESFIIDKRAKFGSWDQPTMSALKRCPPYSGVLFERVDCTVEPPLKWPPLYNGQDFSSQPYTNTYTLLYIETSLQRPPIYNGHLSTTASYFGPKVTVVNQQLGDFLLCICDTENKVINIANNVGRLHYLCKVC